MEQLAVQPANLPSFDRDAFVQQVLAQVKGHLTEGEGLALLDASATWPGLGCICEIGAMMGLSTAFLAQGSKLSSRGPVVSIDTFIALPRNLAQFPFPGLAKDGSYYARFETNMRALGLWGSVKPIISNVKDVKWGRRNYPIRGLFIDGDHEYESVKADFYHFYPWMVRGGWVAFHDRTQAPGVAQLLRELESQYEFMHQSRELQFLKVP